MLPFKRQQDASASGPVEIMDRVSPHSMDHDPLESAMQELASALEAKDFASAAQVFKAAFQIMELEPHGEIEHGD